MIETVVAKEVFHESVLEAPGTIYAGVAMNEEIKGRLLLAVVPLATVDDAEILPTLSCAVT